MAEQYSGCRDDPGESDMKTFIPSPRRDERVYGLTRPRDIPNTLEDTAGRYSPPILEPTAADEDDDEWNLDRVPTNENVRPRYFTRVKAPDGEEHVPMIEPDGLAAPRVIPAAIPRTLEDTAERYSPPILEPTAAEEGEEEWNLDPVPINENVRPRYFSRVKAPNGLELVPLTEPEGQAAPRDVLVESQASRPRDLPLELVVKDPPKEITPLLQDIQPTKTDVLQQGRPDADATQKKSDVENNLNDALKRGDFDTIEQEVNAKSLTSCETNALLKAFEVNKRLSNLIEEGGPEKEDLQALASSVEEFASELIAPLKSDDDTRNTFWRCLDHVVDTAIEAEQKKFLSHPVVYNLLESMWYGTFLNSSKSPWKTPRRWAFLFLTCFTLIDIFLFPILFAVFYIAHVFRGNALKRRGSEIGFLVALSNNVSDRAFNLVKNTMCYIIHKYGYKTANYCVVQRETERSVNFDVPSGDETSLLKKVKSMEKETRTYPMLHKDLSQVLDSFKSANASPGAKKVLMIFVSDPVSWLGDLETSSAELLPLVEEAKMRGIILVPVGIGEYAELTGLTTIASTEMTAFHFGDYESPRTLGKAIIQGVEGKDIYEYYLDYFKTPFFIFVRDSLSYLSLLGLHFAICLSPSTVSFSSLEWAIFLFFLGRIAMEVDQFVNAKKAERKQTKRTSARESSYEDGSDSHRSRDAPTNGNVVLRKFSNYFSDRWNQLDFIILVLYVITFILRMVTWGASTEVYNNRPLAVAFYLYGLVAMFLTLRVFGHVMECRRDMGAIQIALFFIMRDVVTIFWQFLATILAFSLVITKIYIAERSYSKKSSSDDEMACSTGGFGCWWSMAKHLSWSLLGIADLEPFSSADGPSVSLAQLLYSMFLIMGVILLVNMMIALLSNTYNRVEENSLREWSFKKAITIKSYSVYHPVPVPFNLVSLSLLALHRLWRRCRPKGRAIHKTAVDENGRGVNIIVAMAADVDDFDCETDLPRFLNCEKVEYICQRNNVERRIAEQQIVVVDQTKMALDNLVVNLKRMYFAKHGYSFPLTDERKMDRLLHEVDGSRRMTNQIMRRVFRPLGCGQEKFKSGASAWQSLGIGIEGYALTFMGVNFCEECKRSSPSEIHGARYLFPFSPQMPRMEVLIEESGECRILAVGVVFDSYYCHAMPGWLEKTVGYHVDDGKVFEEGCSALGREVKDAMAYRGDLVSCEVDFDGAKQGRVPVVFSLNGREVARASIQYTAGQTSLFPYVAMGYEGIRVLANMCSRKISAVQPLSSELSHQEVQTGDSVLATNEATWQATRGECEAVRRELAHIAKKSETREREMAEKIKEHCQVIDDLKGVLREMSQELSRIKTMK